MASEPPIDFRMAATASACASVFSPVSSVSPAIRGSANARALASALASFGRSCSTTETSSGSEPAASPCSAAWLFIGRGIGCEQERGDRLHLLRSNEGGRVSHPFEFDQPRPRAAPRHLLGSGAREQIRLRASQQQRLGADGIVELPQGSLPGGGGLLVDGPERDGDRRVIVQRE